jgi:hypothetical protein
MTVRLYLLNHQLFKNIGLHYRWYVKTLRDLNDFYEAFCQKAVDTDAYRGDIATRRASFDKIQYKDIILKDYWGIHQPAKNIVERISPYITSITFSNVFEICLILIEVSQSEAPTIKMIVQEVIMAAFAKIGQM